MHLLKFFPLISFIILSESNFLKSLTRLRKFTASTIIATGLIQTPTIVHADISIAEQLKTLKSEQIVNTKYRVETGESEAIARALQYPEGYLIGRARVLLVQDDVGISPSNPYGVSESYLVNAELGKEEATLFVLAVGREGPPLAAKKITNVKDIKFPLLVEITTDDLLFPYTKEAWEASPNRLDTIALTAIFSADPLLSTANTGDRLGFGQSEPTNIAGVTTRTTAVLTANKKIDLSLYSKDEISLLSTIDEELARKSSDSLLLLSKK